MQTKRNHSLLFSPKALIVCALAMLLLPLPYSNLQAGGASRVSQGKTEPGKRPPASNAHSRTAPSAPKASPPPASNNSRNSNRTASSTTRSSSSRSNTPTARPQPRAQPQVRPTPPTRISHSQTQSNRASTHRTTSPRTHTVAPPQHIRTPNVSTTTSSTGPSRSQVTVTRSQTPSPRHSTTSVNNGQTRTSPPTVTVKRSSVSTTTHAQQPRNTTSTNIRKTTTATVSRSNHEQANRRDRPDNTSISATRTTAPSRNQHSITTSTRSTSNRNQVHRTDQYPRQQTVAQSYTQNRDTARTLYLDRRRHAQEATGQRHEHDRQQALRDHAPHRDNDRNVRSAKHVNHPGQRDYIVTHSHRHGNNCGHYYYDNFWHDYPSRHTHYDGCGHYYHSGSWISFTFGHIHGPGCGHFYESGIWLSYAGSRHHHHVGCGHFYYDGFWHNTSYYHVHGPSCGHYYYNSRWNSFPQTHVHSEYCGHLYDGSQWLIVNSNQHVHNSNCGHFQFAGHWYSYPRSSYTMNRDDSLYFFVNLGDYRNRNIPDWAYEDYLQNGRPTDIFRSSTPLAKAYAAFAQGNYYDSLVQFKLAGMRDPQNGLIYLARAQAQIAVKDYRSAFEDIMEGMTLFPEWADTYLNLTEIYSRPEDLDKHTQELKKWVERYPRDFKAHFVLGYFYYFHQDYDEAKNELLYALSWDDGLEPAHILMDHILEFEAESEVLTIEQEASPKDQVEVTTE